MAGGCSVFRLLAAAGMAMAMAGAAGAQASDNTAENAANAAPANSDAGSAASATVARQCSAAATSPGPGATGSASAARLTFDRIDPATHRVFGRLAADGESRPLALADPSALTALVCARQGDLIDAAVDQPDNPTKLVRVVRVLRPVSVWPRLVAMGGALVALLLAASLATKGRPQAFLIGEDRRYSNSKCQLALWFGAVAICYAAAFVLRLLNLGGDFIGGIGLTANVAAVSGFSALSYGGAKAITVGKIAANGLVAKPPLPDDERPSLIRDLFGNDSKTPDLGDFQMILISVVAVAIFVTQAFHFLGALEISPSVTLPDVDTTLLASFGIGQGAYLAKKGASNVGDG